MSSEPKVIGISDLKTNRQIRKYKDIMSYRNDSESLEKSFEFRTVVFRVLKTTKKNGSGTPIVHLLDLLRKGDAMVDWTERSGLPWCERNYETKEHVRNDIEAVNEIRKFWHLLKDGEVPNFPDCLIRTTSSSTVWTYPATIHFGEAAFVIGLVKAFTEQGDSSVLAYNYVSSADGRQRLRNRFHLKDKFFIRLSFNESTVPAWMIRVAFRILWAHIDFARYAGGGVPDATKMLRMLENIENYFINTTLRLPSGIRIRKSCGIPKGSYFSVLISSLVSLLLVEYLSCNLSGTFTEDKVAYGNECIARINQYWDINVCEKIIRTTFGITLNIPECKVSKNIKCIHFFTNN